MQVANNSIGLLEEGKIKLPSSVNTIVPEMGVLEFDGKTLHFTGGNDRRGIILGTGTISSDITVANTITETTVWSGESDNTAFDIGKVLIIHILGKFSTRNQNDTFTLRLKENNNVILSAVCDAKQVTDAPFSAEGFITIRSLGVNGTYVAQDRVVLGNTNKHSVPVYGVVDTTIPHTLSVTVEWSVADINNSFTLMQTYFRAIL